MFPARNPRRLTVVAAAAALLTIAPVGVTAAQAQVTRVRQGSATDVSRTV